MEKIEFTIAIPTYNEQKDLPACLTSIANQDYPKKNYEVIIVDNESTDNTLTIARSFTKKINLRIISNKIKDAEVSKKKAYDEAKGDYFMYLDADMRFADSQFIKKMLFPLKEDTQIAGTFVQFKVNKKQPPLTRTLSYDEFQRDPIFAFFTHGISSILKEKREKYWLCLCTKEKIPPQGLMIYRRSLIKEYIKDKRQLIDNDIPAILVEEGHTKFAFVPYTGVEHLLVRNLKELAKKRIRNLERTYFPNESERKFKWINWKKDWPKVGIWLLYTHSPLMFLIAIAKSIKSKDFCFLNEPALNIVSTYAIIYAVLKNKWKK